MEAAPPNNDKTTRSVLTYRSIWISDIHLGTKGCQAEALLEFLRYTESEYLYLVGDIVDGWQLRKKWYWPQEHNDVIQKIMKRARSGAKVFYIPGNHDEAARDFCGLQFGGVLVTNQIVHTLLDGKRFLILHGDQFDAVIRYTKWLAIMGDVAYTFALSVNTVFNRIRRKMGFSYWSLSAYLKQKVKNAVEYIGAYEKLVADDARRHQVDGVICGHIHQPEIKEMKQAQYCNCGDWVESCSALVEDKQGVLSIIRWPDDRERLLTSLGVDLGQTAEQS